MIGASSAPQGYTRPPPPQFICHEMHSVIPLQLPKPPSPYRDQHLAHLRECIKPHDSETCHRILPTPTYGSRDHVSLAWCLQQCHTVSVPNPSAVRPMQIPNATTRHLLSLDPSGDCRFDSETAPRWSDCSSPVDAPRLCLDHLYPRNDRVCGKCPVYGDDMDRPTGCTWWAGCVDPRRDELLDQHDGVDLVCPRACSRADMLTSVACYSYYIMEWFMQALLVRFRSFHLVHLSFLSLPGSFTAVSSFGPGRSVSSYP
jgi:hypothetical protein